MKHNVSGDAVQFACMLRSKSTVPKYTALVYNWNSTEDNPFVLYTLTEFKKQFTCQLVEGSCSSHSFSLDLLSAYFEEKDMVHVDGNNLDDTGRPLEPLASRLKSRRKSGNGDCDEDAQLESALALSRKEHSVEVKKKNALKRKKADAKKKKGVNPKILSKARRAKNKIVIPAEKETETIDEEEMLVDQEEMADGSYGAGLPTLADMGARIDKLVDALSVQGNDLAATQTQLAALSKTTPTVPVPVPPPGSVLPAYVLPASVPDASGLPKPAPVSHALPIAPASRAPVSNVLQLISMHDDCERLHRIHEAEKRALLWQQIAMANGNV